MLFLRTPGKCVEQRKGKINLKPGEIPRMSKNYVFNLCMDQISGGAKTFYMGGQKTLEGWQMETAEWTAIANESIRNTHFTYLMLL